MAIVDAINKVTGGHGSTIEEAVKGLSSGGSGGILVVHSTADSNNGYVLDKTWQEIHDFEGLVIILEPYEGAKQTKIVTSVTSADDTYMIYALDPLPYTCSSPNDYPTRDDEA